MHPSVAVSFRAGRINNPSNDTLNRSFRVATGFKKRSNDARRSLEEIGLRQVTDTRPPLRVTITYRRDYAIATDDVPSWMRSQIKKETLVPKVCSQNLVYPTTYDIPNSPHLRFTLRDS